MPASSSREANVKTHGRCSYDHGEVFVFEQASHILPVSVRHPELAKEFCCGAPASRGRGTYETGCRFTSEGEDRVVPGLFGSL
jgi:hypothetical protein